MKKKKGKKEILRQAVFLPLFLFFSSIILPIILPISSASVIISDPPKEKYNLGEKISVDVSIIENFEGTGTLSLVMSCNENNATDEVTLSMKNVRVQKSQQQQVSDTLTTIIPGGCKIIAKFDNNLNTTEKTETRQFLVSRELTGAFSVKKSLMQLGQSNIMAGDIYYLSGNTVNGTAQLYFKKESQNYYVDMTAIENGKLSYTLNTTSYPAGDYVFDILAKDSFGNEKTFAEAIRFRVSNIIKISAGTDKQEYAPGEKIEVSGAINPEISDYNLLDAMVKIKFADAEIELKADSEFSQKIDVPENAKSGKSRITITVEDYFGNQGAKEIEISILQVPNLILLEVNKRTFRPGENLTLVPIIYDQANDLIAETVNVKIESPDKKTLMNSDIKTNQTLIYSIGSFADPGNYKIVLKAGALRTEENIVVEKVEQLMLKLDNQTVMVNNTGNIPSSEEISLELSGGKNYTLNKRISLNPDTAVSIDLGREIPAGNYSLKIPKTQWQDEQFYNLSTTDKRSFATKYLGISPWISGQRGISANPFLLVFIAVVVSVLIAGFIYRQRLVDSYSQGRKQDKEDESEDVEAQEMNEFLKHKREKLNVKEHSGENQHQQHSPDRVDRENPEVKKFVKTTLEKHEKEKSEMHHSEKNASEREKPEVKKFIESSLKAQKETEERRK